MLELLKEAALRRECSIRAREAFADQVIRQSLGAYRELLGRRSNGRGDIRLVEFLAALGNGRNQCDTKAAAPIPSFFKDNARHHLSNRQQDAPERMRP